MSDEREEIVAPRHRCAIDIRIEVNSILRARYSSVQMMAAHVAEMIQEIDRLRAENDALRTDSEEEAW